MSGRDDLMRTIAERDWQATVLQWARQGGFCAYHVRRSDSVSQGAHHPRRGDDHDDARGVPDLLLAHPVRQLVLFVELKRESGRLTPDQERWLDTLEWAGCEAAVWKPSDHLVVRARLLGEGR